MRSGRISIAEAARISGFCRRTIERRLKRSAGPRRGRYAEAIRREDLDKLIQNKKPGPRKAENALVQKLRDIHQDPVQVLLKYLCAVISGADIDLLAYSFNLIRRTDFADNIAFIRAFMANDDSGSWDSIKEGHVLIARWPKDSFYAFTGRKLANCINPDYEETLAKISNRNQTISSLLKRIACELRNSEPDVMPCLSYQDGKVRLTFLPRWTYGYKDKVEIVPGVIESILKPKFPAGINQEAIETAATEVANILIAGGKYKNDAKNIFGALNNFVFTDINLHNGGKRVSVKWLMEQGVSEVNAKNFWFCWRWLKGKIQFSSEQKNEGKKDVDDYSSEDQEKGGKGHFCKPISRLQIASILGVTRQTVSRWLRQRSK